MIALALLGGSWADFILDAVQKLMDFARDKANELLGIDTSMFDIAAVLTPFADAYKFVNQMMPLNTCLGILLAAFVVKAGIRVARHVIGWIPGVDG